MILKAEGKKGVVYNISEFAFSDLVNNKKSLTPEKEEKQKKVSEYKFTAFNRQNDLENETHKNHVRQENKFAEENEFFVSPIVEKYRGLKNQNKEDYQSKVNEGIERELTKIRKEFNRRGYEEGKKRGYEENIDNFYAESALKLDKIDEMVNEVMGLKHTIVQEQKISLISIIRSYTKWIILRELENDDKYIYRLLEKLILELGNTENLLIKVNKKNFEQMPEVIKIIEQKLGPLKNVRLEIDFHQELGGIVIESPFGIIDGSLDSQLENIDKAFSKVEIE